MLCCCGAGLGQRRGAALPLRLLLPAGQRRARALPARHVLRQGELAAGRTRVVPGSPHVMLSRVETGPDFVPGSPHAVVLSRVETGPDFVPGSPHVVLNRVETGPDFVPGSPHVVAARFSQVSSLQVSSSCRNCTAGSYCPQARQSPLRPLRPRLLLILRLRTRMTTCCCANRVDETGPDSVPG